MLRFERTRDLELVRRILTDRSVYPHSGDDFAPPVEEFRPNEDPRIWYVLAIQDDVPVALFTFLPRSRVLWEVHAGILRPKRTGQHKGWYLLGSAIEWMFENSPARRIIAEVPASNRLALKLAWRTMQPFGRNPESFQKNGKLQDLLLFGISG